MKKCMNCGNLGEENSTTCEVCGSSLQEVPEQTSGTEEKAPAKGQEQVNKAPEQKAAPKGQRPQGPDRRPRRMSGPQIYGQSEGGPNAQAYGPQGAIRREVPARSTNEAPTDAQNQPSNAQNRPARPAAQPMGQPSNAQNRPARPAAQPMGQPSNAQNRPARPAAQPMGQPSNAQDRPARPAGQPMGQPLNAQAQQMNAQNQQANAQGRPVRNAGAPMNAQTQGRPVNAQGQRPMGPAGQPMRQPGVPMNMQGRPKGIAPAVHPGKRMEAARSALKSPVFILIALLNTVCLGGAIAAIFMHQMNYSQLIRLISDISMPTQLAGYMETVKKLLGMLDSGMLPVNIALHIPDLFLCLGLWLICITVRNADEEMSGVGFACMKVYVVINMIVTCVVVLAGLIVSVTLVVAAWVSGTKSTIVLAAVMLAAMIITALAAIMYYFCYLATIKVCRLNASAGEPYGQVSVYVALIHVIIGLTGIVGLLSGIVNSEISNIVGSVGKIGWMLLFAVWIFSYKGKMSEFED